jgi:predicted nucleic acid-binding protein
MRNSVRSSASLKKTQRRFAGNSKGSHRLSQPAIVLKLIVEDPDDNRVLECAEEGKADTIVSGDRHLLRLESFGNTPIVRVREFLNAFSVGETKCL